MPANEALGLAVVACAAAAAFVCLAPSRSGFCRDLAVAALFAVTLLYAGRRYAALDWFDLSRRESWWQWSFAVTEGIALLYEFWSFFVLRRTSDHSRQADQAELEFRGLPRSSLPAIAIFIPTFSEPAELVTKTLQAAASLRDRYPGRLNVYCLDDGRYPRASQAGTPEGDEAELRWRRIQQACEDLGVVYWARKVKHRAKAGNLQYAFKHTTEEIIVVLDCDFHVDPEHFLPRTVGLLLGDPGLGLVQVPQCFVNPDPVGHNLCAPQAICDSQTAFMRIVQPGRDYHGNAFCVGTGWVARRSALEAIGGCRHLTTVTEDLEMTYRLTLAGYRTLYLNEMLAFGLAPESVPDFLRQQGRWCCGTLQQLVIPSGCLRGRHRLLDRLFYLDPPLYWLTHLATLQVLLAPVMFWFLGIDTIPDPNNQVLGTILPRLGVRALLLWWLTEGIALPLVAAVSKALAAPQVALTIAKWALVDPRAPFPVTGKGGVRSRAVARWGLFLLFAGITCLILAGMLMNEFDGPSAAMHARSPLNYLWSVSGAILCFLAALVCIELPTPDIDYLSLKSVQRGNMLQAVRGIIRRIFMVC